MSYDCPGGGDQVFVGDTRPEAEIPERTKCTVCDKDDVLVLGTNVGHLSSNGWFYKLRAHKAKVAPMFACGVATGLGIGFGIGTAVAPQAHSAPYICFQPEHAQDVLCAGSYSQRPPGYSLQDPGTWQPWAKYSPTPGGRY